MRIALSLLMTTRNLARGHPNASCLPSEETRRVLAELQVSDLRRGLRYGDESGDKGFLDELRSFLERHAEDDDFSELQTEGSSGSVAKNHLFVTNGVSHGLDLLCATQTRRGDVVLVERPTYFLVKGILQSHDLTIRGLPMHATTGCPDVDQLVELVETGAMECPRMIYIIPAHQNPTACTMPIGDRIKLTEFACRHGILVAADEVYHLLDWRNVSTDGPRPARMSMLSSLVRARGEYPSSGGCVSVSSFTKIFAPGIRCGWIEGSKEIVDSLARYGYIRSQGGCCPLVGEIMRNALESRVADEVLNGLRSQYKVRAEKLCSALEKEPRIKLIHRPLGGYFAWIQFPDSVNSKEFLEFCAHKVTFMPGVRCDVGSSSDHDVEEGAGATLFASHARLCFADLDLDDLDRGIVDLIACFQEYMARLENGD